jgi:hypothetical protein
VTSRLPLAVLFLLISAPFAAAQPPAAVSDLKTNIASLASLDYPVRMNAARVVRRAPATEAVPALTDAVRLHSDQFVRYRALVLLTAFNDRGTRDLMVEMLRDRNDRLREVAYKWLEEHPDPRLTTTLVGSLQTEQAEFVRPALVAALAALDDDPQVRRVLLAETTRGLDLFRSAVIDALGHHRAEYAVEAIAGIMKLDGPLRDGAVMALGRIGGARARAELAEITAAPADLMLTLRAARCLAGENCDAHLTALNDAASGAGPAPVVRAALAGLSAVAATGNNAALTALIAVAARGGLVRDQSALGLGTVALRRPDVIVAWLDAAPDNVRASAIGLLKDGFDRLEEDFAEEQFFSAARAVYWKAAEGSTTRTLAATLIQRLEF